jgi:GTP-binding protein
MAIPQVVIVGRPNVGKSSLFNWLCGRRIAIVDDVAGVTRDRITHLVNYEGRYFELVDTGGIGITDADNLTQEVEHQIELALEAADVVLFVVDTRAGITALDEEVARRLRYLNKPILCVANKTDAPSWDPEADVFYKLGRGKLVRVSVHQNRNRDELLRLIVERLPPVQQEPPGEPEMKLAIVGRRNTGKSTFINTLYRGERMIVSEVPGTTRDSVDVRFEMDGKAFIAIDTPGVRRSKSIRTDIDFYGTHRAQRSIRRADVVLLFLDCTERISKVDKQLCAYINENFKPCIFVVNKWDLLADKMPTERWVRYLRDCFPNMWHTPIAFITGKTGKNVKALLNHAQMLFKQSRQRIGTGELNRLIRSALERHSPPVYQNKVPKIYYAAQIGIQPPTIVLVCNEPKAFSAEYRRYLLGALRDHVPFAEIPIKLYLHRRSRASAVEAPPPEEWIEPDEETALSE